jgi:hypothetical protein|tara:strand:- start:60 stop:173 length:114 start_codon:yes stop_codon:yes gene_type:complete
MGVSGTGSVNGGGASILSLIPTLIEPSGVSTTINLSM